MVSKKRAAKPAKNATKAPKKKPADDIEVDEEPTDDEDSEEEEEEEGKVDSGESEDNYI